MSTMLRSAVMSLLSKTLQTFLYKYLSDVDVEGVAMPSLMDVDGQSGWGVRLCNVKLREGVELMTLPGKRTTKKRKPPGDEQQQQNAEESSDTMDDVKASVEKQADVQVQGTKEITSEAAPSAVREAQDDEEVAESTAQIPPATARARLLTEEDTAVDSNISSRAPSPPPVICRTGGSSVLACFQKGGDKSAQAKIEETDSGEPTKPSADELVQTNVVFNTENLEEKGIPEATVVQGEPVLDGEKNEGEGQQQDDDAAADDDDDDEFMTHEQDMVLSLGVGGRIGTLDVRLMGKELHVTVEDAFLAVEVCPKPDEGDDASRDTATNSDATKEDGSKAKTAKGKAKISPKPDKKTPARTAGERVLESSALARALSAMPHLLLRDCKIRLTVRQEATDDTTKGPEEATEITVDDSVVEINIEMFSITTGEDFLHHRNDEGRPGEETNTEVPLQKAELKRKPSLKSLEESNENEYLVKRIRTGKGPDAGISVKVFPPLRRRFAYSAQSRTKELLAIQRWNHETQFCLFRCSGLDIVSRVYLGKKKEVALRNNDYAWYGDEYDEYTIDSMLFGVDYIATGPMRPLPPLAKVQKSVSDGKPKTAKGDANDYEVDANGIQSTKIQSLFHRVARGQLPTTCQSKHLPSDNCPYCWEDPERPNAYGKIPLDQSIPLPGVVLSLALNDPLDINVDRLTLEVMGDIAELFIKKDAKSTDDKANKDPNQDRGDTTSSTMMNWRFRKPKKEQIKRAFPSYMQPETIELAGAYLSKINVRFQMMQSDQGTDSGLKYRYIESAASCLTVDFQKHQSKEKDFQDVRVGIGYLEMNEYCGVVVNNWIAVGQQLTRTNDLDSSPAITAGPTLGKKSNMRTLWPSTATAMLQLRPNAECLAYESRENHGLQLRYLSLNSPLFKEDPKRASINVRIGKIDVDMPFSSTTEFSKVADEANAVFQKRGLKKPDEPPPPVAKAPPTDKQKENRMKYVVRVDSCGLKLDPTMRVRLPELTFSGEQSSVNGMFLESVLQNVALEYGRRTRRRAPQGVSLRRLAALPDNVRLRVLLFVRDLSPLEGALGVKKEGNSFLRYSAVNRAIVKVAKKMPRTVKRKKSRPLDHGRQHLLNELMKLDDHTLHDMLSSYHNTKVTEKGKVVRKG